MTTDRRPIAEILDTACRVAVVLLGFSIAVSTTLSNVVVIVVGVLWLATGDLPSKLRRIAANPAAWLPLALFAWLLGGVAYTSIDAGECLRGALKYRELLYIPIFLTLLPASNAKLSNLADVITAVRERRVGAVDYRTWSMFGFAVGAICELAASYGEWLFGADWGFQTSTDYVVFKDRIIHNFLMAYLLFVLAHHALATAKLRWMMAVIGGLALINMMAMVQGRTGYLALVLLTAMFMMQKFGARGIAYAATSLAVLATIAYVGSATFRFRVHESLLQVQTSLGNRVHPKDARMTAEEPRLKFYRDAIELIRRRPFIGSGAGSFEHESAKLAPASESPTTVDPHNEYLAIAAQSGLIGLGLWLAILIAQWRAILRLALPDRHLAQGMIALMATGCLVNSLLLGFTGGLFWSYFAGLFTSSVENSANSSAAELLVSAPLPSVERRSAA